MMIILCFRITREHREKLAKCAKTLCDNTKVKLRDIANRFIHFYIQTSEVSKIALGHLLSIT